MKAMKNIVKTILMMAVLPIMALSCTPVEEVHQPGEPDLENCYGVYFPTQEASGSHALDPSEPKSVEFVVKRLNNEDEISVPVEVTASEDGIFEVGELYFAEGQSETTLELTFDAAQIGVDYSVTVSINDPQYASTYGTEPTYISYSVVIEKWVELGVGQYMDCWYSQDEAGLIPTVAPVKILQNENNPNEFRIYDPFVNYFFGPEYPYKERPAEYFEIRIFEKGEIFTPYSNANPVTIPLPDLIWYDNIVTGYVNSNYDDTICYVHPGYGFSDYVDPATWLHNKVLGYQDNGLPIAFQIAPFVYMWSVGGWNYAEEPLITIVLPGGVLTDYSISVEAGYSQDGVQPLAFTFGNDVASIKYAAFEGALNAAGVAEKVKEVTKDENAAVVTKPAAGEDGTVPPAVVGVKLPATGEYTVVAVGLDETGVAQSNASLVITYVAAGESVPVNISAGLASTDKYVPLGFSPETSVEYYLYGEDLTDVKIGLFSTVDLQDVQACIAAVLESPSADAETLAAINDEVYVDVIKGLTPGTEYRMIVYASNGYEETAILTDPITTAGEPSPVYASYTLEDIDMDLLPTSSEGYFGTYNYYVRDMDENGNIVPMRHHVGQITLSDSEYPDSDPDSYGVVSEYVTVTGLVPYAKQAGMNETTTFEYYDGVLYTLSDQLGMYAQRYYTQLMAMDPDTGKLYNASVLGGFVADGYIAFVNAYASQGVNITGLYLAAFSDEACTDYLGGLDAFVDILLVDPEVDVDAPSSAAQSAMSVSDLNKLQFNLGSEINYVETERGRIHSIIDRMHAEKKAPKMAGYNAGIKGVWDAPSVEFSVEEVSSQFQPKADFNNKRNAQPVLYR